MSEKGGEARGGLGSGGEGWGGVGWGRSQNVVLSPLELHARFEDKLLGSSVGKCLQWLGVFQGGVCLLDRLFATTMLRRCSWRTRRILAVFFCLIIMHI